MILKPPKNKKRAQERALKAMSDYIRARDFYTCVTCGKKGDKSNIDCGHFISRRYEVLKYDETNTAAQCYRCNRILGGNWSEFFEYMIKKYGHEYVDNLLDMRKKIVKRTIDDYYRIELYYLEKLTLLTKGEI